jgi:hypothetical protein
MLPTADQAAFDHFLEWLYSDAFFEDLLLRSAETYYRSFSWALVIKLYMLSEYVQSVAFENLVIKRIRTDFGHDEVVPFPSMGEITDIYSLTANDCASKRLVVLMHIHKSKSDVVSDKPENAVKWVERCRQNSFATLLLDY